MSDCIPYYEPGGRLTVHALAALTGKRFVVLGAHQAGPALNTSTTGGNLTAAVPGAGVKADGVMERDTASGAKGTLLCTPGMIIPVEAGATVTAGSEVEVDNLGRIINLNTGKAVGKAISGGTVGTDITVRLY